MVGHFQERNNETELLIDLLIGSLQEEGYEVKRYSESKGIGVSCYDALGIKRHDGKETKVYIDEFDKYDKSIFDK